MGQKYKISASSTTQIGFYVPKRYIVTFLGFLGIFLVVAKRTVPSVAMVAMVKNSNNTTGNHTPAFNECSSLIHEENYSNSHDYKGEKYEWDSKTQGVILGAFQFGYVFTQAPGGFLAEKFGGKWLCGTAIFVGSLFCLLTPLAAAMGAIAFISLQALLGLVEGVIIPSMNLIASRWSPELERSRMSSRIHVGYYVGVVVGMSVTGVLCDMDFLGGWPSAFYIFATTQADFYVPKRCIVTFLGFIGIFALIAMRTVLSVAIVAMVNNSNHTTGNHTPAFDECSSLIHEENYPNPHIYKGQKYEWDSKTQGIILGAFHYGYVFTQIPGGLLAEKFGGKWLCGISIFLGSLFCLLTPLAVTMGVPTFISFQVLHGLIEGVTIPSMNLIVSRWSPKLERSRISSRIFAGFHVGTVTGMSVSGFLCDTDVLGGWPSAFYTFGMLGSLWFLLWGYFVHESPLDHPSISKEELLIFEQSKEQPRDKKSKMPWRAVFTSLPFWAVTVAHVGQNFGFVLLITELPTYLYTALHLDITSAGYFSALPYLLLAISCVFSSALADKIRKSNKIKVTAIRKMFNSIGVFIPGICFLGITMAGCRPKLIMVLISLAVLINGFTSSGFSVTHIDMSPDFAGTLYGMTHTAASVAGFIGPTITGIFIFEGATVANWNYVFYVTAAAYILTGAFYAIFASAELQPWANGNDNHVKQTQEDCNVEVNVKH